MAHQSATPDVPPALRRNRWRRGLRVAVLAAGGMALAVMLVLLWLLGSGGGRDVVLNQLVAHLPDGTTLHWGRADGVLLGGVSLQDVAYDQAAPALHVSARQLHLDIALWPLLAGEIRFTALALDGAVLDLPPPMPPEPFAWPRWPQVLPDLGLPLTIAADAVTINGLAIQRQGEPLITIHSVRGALAIGAGFVRAGHLLIDSERGRFTVDGQYAPHTADGMDVTVSALLVAPAGQQRPRFGLVARGTPDALEVALAGYAPGKVQAQWSLRGRNAPQWNLTAQADALDPGLITDGTPGTALAFHLDADGAGETSHWQGRARLGTLEAVLHPATVQTNGQSLEVKPVRLELASPGVSGALHAAGRVDFGVAATPQFTLALTADDLTLAGGSGADAVPVHLRTRLNLGGQTEAWTLTGNAALTRASQHATLTLSADGNGQRLRIESLRADMPGGRLEAAGSLAWQPALGWDAEATLTGVDPGWLVPAWPGALTARIRSHASTDAAGTLRMDLDTRDLGGQLRQRAVSGRMQFRLSAPAGAAAPPQIQGEASLRLGASRMEVNGAWGDQVDITATVSPLHLADLIPDAGGQLQGRIQISGTLRAPALVADLGGRDLQYAGIGATTLELTGALPARTGSDGTLALRLSGLTTGSLALEHLQLQATGTTRNARLSVDAAGDAGTLSVSGSARQQGTFWRGSVDALLLHPAGAALWELQGPVGYAQTRSGWNVQHGCLVATGGGTLCGEVDWPRRIQVDAHALPLALAAPFTAQWLPEPAPGHPWRLRGALDVTADLDPSGTAWQGHIGLTSADGGLRASEQAPRDVIGYRDLALNLDLTPDALRARLHVGLDAGGQLRLALDTGRDADAPLEGNLTLDVRDLTWLELLAQDIAASHGRLTGSLGLGGTRTRPNLRGQAQLAEFSAELPALAITLDEGEIHLAAEPDGSAHLGGSVRSGAGMLHLDGSLNWHGDDVPLVLKLHGTQVLASDTRDLRLIINPDLTVRHAAGQPLEVSGSVGIPAGLLDLERLDSGVAASADVVVLDPVTPARARGGSTPLRLDLTLSMGEDVRLRGFGLNGKLDGSLRVRAEPGHELLGSGQLDVSGGYKAYGQALNITRGTLVFSNVPISDPVIDLTAERKIEAEGITAGITVTGRASAPDVTVWSDPASDNTQALAYLAFGRSLSSLTGNQSQQIDAASAALSAGSNFIAGQIGHRIGLDDAGVTTSRALGGSVLGIGKQISPRLYVGFGVSLLGTGQVLTLKYLLRKGFDVELESSTVENRGSINWRHESD